jgi:hypothetical protein
MGSVDADVPLNGGIVNRCWSAPALDTGIADPPDAPIMEGGVILPPQERASSTPLSSQD